MRILLVLFFTAVNGLFVSAQFQNNNWRFGNGGGLNFDSVGNVTIASGQTATQEGSAAISNRTTGELLFYTDGLSVWNANDEVMPNGTGLLGGTQELTSSTSAAAIVRDPSSETMYYIFTLDEQSSTNGLRYSIVDMTLDGGLGAIPTNLKNIPVYSTTSEKLQIIPNADQDGYWIITHDNQEALVAFELTTSGLSTTPVISNVTSPQFNGAGHFKVNRTFDRLAIGSLFESNISLIEFDNATGVFSNPISWAYNFGTTLQYGVEFSPNGQVLYVSNLEKIVQYDISSNNPEVIENTGFEVFVSNFLTGNPATMQIASNNKIYVNNGGSIGVINCPDFLGAACNWQQSAIAGAAFGGYGLHIWSYDIAATPVVPEFSLEASDNCVNSTINFDINIPFDFDEININWGDGNTDSFTTNNFSYSFIEEGAYDINVEIISGCQSFQFDSTFVVEVCNVEISDFIITGDLCDASSPIGLQIPISSTFDQIIVNFGDVNSPTNEAVFTNVSNTLFLNHLFSSPGNYEVCVNYIINGELDVIVCLPVEIGLCCEFEVITENLCTESPSVFSVFGTNEINSVVWQITNPVGEISELEGLQVSTSLVLEGLYSISVSITGECGITNLTSTENVINCEKVFCDPFIPNVFTPNNDGTNEFFTPVFPCDGAEFGLKIYNRWGEKIFDNGETNRGWNGGINGYFVPDGTYIYEVEYQKSEANRALVSGTLTLLR